MTVSESLRNLAPDKERVGEHAQWAESNFIFDYIAHERAVETFNSIGDYAANDPPRQFPQETVRLARSARKILANR